MLSIYPFKDLLTNPFFNQAIPLLSRKQSAFAIHDIPGLWRVHWQLGTTTILSTFYTPIDQVCLLWGFLSLGIFGTAQFVFWDWGLQAWFWSGLSLIGTTSMVKLTQYCARIASIRRTIIAWVVLMLGGVVMTDLSIFAGWGTIITGLCPLWLGLNAVGYFYSGLELRSRAFLIVGTLHVLSIPLLPWVGVWQFLMTGIVIGLGAILLAELQWDSIEACAIHQSNNSSNL